jgi:hypothetical protein
MLSPVDWWVLPRHDVSSDGIRQGDSTPVVAEHIGHTGNLCARAAVYRVGWPPHFPS